MFPQGSRTGFLSSLLGLQKGQLGFELWSLNSRPRGTLNIGTCKEGMESKVQVLWREVVLEDPEPWCTAK